MSFTIEQIDSEVITGKRYKFAIPKTPEDFVEVNNQKLEIFPVDKNTIHAILIHDPDERNGTYNYFIKDSKGNRSLTLPANEYAVFIGSFETLADVDTFIDSCFDELQQSIDYRIGGTNTIQLLDFEHQKITIKMPTVCD